MKQVISIHPNGTVEGLLHKKGQGVNLLALGKATVVRASEVLWCDSQQRWKVEFREGAGKYNGLIMDGYIIVDAGITGLEQLPDWAQLPNCIMGEDSILYFTSYEIAVQAEIDVLNSLRLAGKLPTWASGLFINKQPTQS